MMHQRMQRQKSPIKLGPESSRSIDATSLQRGTPVQVLQGVNTCSSSTLIHESIVLMSPKPWLFLKRVTQVAVHAERWMDSFPFGAAFCYACFAPFTSASISARVHFFSPHDATSRRLADSTSNI